MMKKRTKDIYIITGASSDVALHFLNRMGRGLQENKSVKIFAAYRTSDKQLVELVQKYPSLQLEIMPCDFASEQDTIRWIQEVRQQCEKEQVVPTHIVHLAAPQFSYMRLKELEWQRFTNVMDVSLRSLVLLCREFLPLMAKKKFGRVAVMLTAYTINVPPKFMSDYVTAKYALLGFLRAAASEYAGKGVTINGISPNMMETKFLAAIDARSIEMNAQASAMKRNITLDETCSALEFLLSDGASYLQGENMNLTGGDRM